MSKLYFFIESRIGQIPTLILFAAVLILVAAGILSFDEVQKLLTVVIGWFNG